MIIEKAVEVLKIEAQGILDLVDRLDDNFTRMVDLILNSGGRVIIGGIGKSGIIGRKIVATLNSTGTRSLFLHPVEAMHGDLGIVSADDIFLALSHSGETDELNILLASIRKIGCPIIAFTGSKASTLAQNSDLIIDVGIKQEACPMGLAPTTSTTALLAMGDALAVVLVNKKHFKVSDFKKIHPGGALGQRLIAKISDIMLTGNNLPKIFIEASIKEAIAVMDQKKLGTVLIINQDNVLAGIFTDGDLRRIIARGKNIYALDLKSVMIKNPKHLSKEDAVYDALYLMEKSQITVLPVTTADHKLEGILHLHDILGKGDFKFNGNI